MADRRRILLVGLLTVALLPGAAAGATRTYSTGPLSYAIPDVGSVDDWEWRGPTPELHSWATRLGADNLASRAERLDAGRIVQIGKASL